MNFENILIEKDGKTALITINRPESLNALNHKTIQELSNTFEHLNNDSSVRVIILRKKKKKEKGAFKYEKLSCRINRRFW